jgi:hypothetical protein
MNGKGDKRRPADRTRTTKAQYDSEFDRIFGPRMEAAEVRQAQLDEHRRQWRKAGLSDEEIDQQLEDREL